MLKIQTIPSRNSSAIWRSIDGEVIIFLPRNKEGKKAIMRILNDTGSRIWESIDGNTSIKKIGEMLCEAFSVNHSQALSDLKKFLHYLEGANLILFKNNEAKKE